MFDVDLLVSEIATLSSQIETEPRNGGQPDAIRVMVGELRSKITNLDIGLYLKSRERSVTV